MKQTNLEIKEEKTVLSNKKKLLKLPSGREETDEQHNNIGKKWKAAARKTRRAKTSWKLIDGSEEKIGWSSSDDCWKWIKRLLTIGNIAAILVFLCLLTSSSYFCLTR